MDETEPKLRPVAAESSVNSVDVLPNAIEARNFSVLTLYQILLRTGWIFKTESIIMPAVLDTIAAMVSGSKLLPGEMAISYVKTQGGSGTLDAATDVGTFTVTFPERCKPYTMLYGAATVMTWVVIDGASSGRAAMSRQSSVPVPM